ncbi:MAG: lactate racemase domain-containing protein [Candidatus Latescibacterota bacterium]
MARIPLRSRAWHGDEQIELPVPGAWSVDVLHPADAPELPEEGLRQALAQPHAGPSLAELAKGKNTALIVVDDLGRPTPAHRIVPHLLALLEAAGIGPGGVSFLIATGSHRQVSQQELERKLGADVVAHYPVHCHDAFHDDLRDLGRLPSGMPVIVNQRVLDAELVIGVSGILPHTLAGFSGGGKILLPGCAGILSIAELHSFEPKRTRAQTEPLHRRPDAREVIESFADRAGLAFSVNTVINSRRELAAIVAGNSRLAHAQAVLRAGEVYRTEIPQELRQSAEIVIVNGYPLDADPVQVSKSQWPRKLFPRASMILYDPACDGIAYHGWSEFQKASVTNMLCGTISEARTDGRYPAPLGALLARPLLRKLGHLRLRREAERTDVSYQAYLNKRGTIHTNTIAKRVMAKRAPLVICSQSFPEWKRVMQFPKSVLLRDWEAVAAAGYLPEEARRVAVIPCAPLQIPA